MLLGLLVRGKGEENAGRRRYRLAAYSTAANVASKALSMLVMYLSVPLTLSYLGNARFGVWMTLASFISFLGFLDFGIGSSLLNEVAHLSASGSRERLRRLISHSLLLLTGLGCIILLVLVPLALFGHPELLFGADNSIRPEEVRDAAAVLALLIGISLPIVGMQRVFWGLQQAFVFYLLSGIGSVVSLAALIALSRVHAPIYALLLGTYGIQLLATVPLLGLLITRKLLGPIHLQEFRDDTKSLLRHGTLFFTLAVGGAVAWDSDFIILSKMAGPAVVAVFAVAVRLFQLVEMPLQMLNAPLWAAYADAAAHNDRIFLRSTLGRAIAVTGVLAVLGGGGILLIHRPLIAIWLHNAVEVPLSVLCVMALWSAIRTTGNAFAMYLNGVRVVRPQIVVVLSFCIVTLPLKIFGALHFGISGLVVASIIGYLATTVLLYTTVFRGEWQSYLKGA